jgi:hypothetical protein
VECAVASGSRVLSPFMTPKRLTERIFWKYAESPQVPFAVVPAFRARREILPVGLGH